MKSFSLISLALALLALCAQARLGEEVNGEDEAADVFHPHRELWGSGKGYSSEQYTSKLACIVDECCNDSGNEDCGCPVRNKWWIKVSRRTVRACEGVDCLDVNDT